MQLNALRVARRSDVASISRVLPQRCDAQDAIEGVSMMRNHPGGRPDSLTPVVALAAFAAATCSAVWVHVAQGVTVCLVVGVVMAPVWWGTLSGYRYAKVLTVLGIASIGFGVFLGYFEGSREVSLALMQAQVLDFAAFVVSIGLLSWCRLQIGSGWTALAYGVGALMDSFLAGLNEVNVWKFSVAIPAALVCLGLARVLKSRWVEIGVLAGLASISLVSDSRSMTAFLVLVIPVLLWQIATHSGRLGARPAQLLLWLAALILGVYNLFQALLLDGVLGEAAMQRSQAQIEMSGSLLLGGRPEAGASVALIGTQPIGYGAGVIPNSTDIWVAKEGMGTLGYDPNNGYVERYMFGSQFEVHSTLGDVWIRLGLPAAIFVVLMLALTVGGALGALSQKEADGVLIFLLLLGTWNIFFGPALPSYPVLALMAALALKIKDPGTCAPPEVVVSQSSGRQGLKRYKVVQ